MKENQELNRKLAVWAGFIRQKTIAELDKAIQHEANLGWVYPGGQWRKYEPDFTESLDACFKWLVPKVHKETHNSIDIRLRRKDTYCEFASEGGWSCHATAETPALALCLAIEKLIDKEGK